MKNKQGGFMGIVLLLLVAGVGAYFYLQYSSSSSRGPSTAQIGDVKVAFIPSDPRAVHTGRTYTVSWNHVGAKTVNIVLMNGNNTYGKQNASPVSASVGTYEWTVPDVMNFANGPGAGYYIVVEEARSQPASGKSQTFIITP
jgi:hypothetical protein